MFDLPSKRDIENISFELLKESHALDVFPTPVDAIVKCSSLLLDEEIDLSRIDQRFINKVHEGLRDDYLSSIGSIRGFIDRSDKIIYLDRKQQKTRQNFVKLHEVGHHVLSWQKGILDHLDDDDTLKFDTELEFEDEANYFASTTLFQYDRFSSEMDKLGLGIKAPMSLAKRFGSSNHAALRKYVELSSNRCALLVLEKIAEKGAQPECFKKDFFVSSSFSQTFGDIHLPDRFGYKWEFVKDYYFRRKYHEKGEINLTTANGSADFCYHFFDNRYNAFVFLFPIGEFKSPKVKVYVPTNFRKGIKLK
jgi:Zn-dependent peptidase ImmA (M78 family)